MVTKKIRHQKNEIIGLHYQLFFLIIAMTPRYALAQLKYNK